MHFHRHKVPLSTAQAFSPIPRTTRNLRGLLIASAPRVVERLPALFPNAHAHVYKHGYTAVSIGVPSSACTIPGAAQLCADDQLYLHSPRAPRVFAATPAPASNCSHPVRHCSSALESRQALNCENHPTFGCAAGCFAGTNRERGGRSRGGQPTGRRRRRCQQWRRRSLTCTWPIGGGERRHKGFPDL